MRLYPDANVVLALLTYDVFSLRAEAIWPSNPLDVVFGDFAKAECVSVIARRVRTGDLTREEASSLFGRLDGMASSGSRAGTTGAEIAEAEGLMRRLDFPLRTPDALHIVIARRSNARLATFDRQMAASARALGLDVID